MLLTEPVHLAWKSYRGSLIEEIVDGLGVEAGYGVDHGLRPASPPVVVILVVIVRVDVIVVITIWLA